MPKLMGLSRYPAFAIALCSTTAFGQTVHQALPPAEGARPAAGPPAASTTTTPTSTDPGDIVVTATRRSTRLQQTPLAITALGGEALEARKIDTAVDLATFVPGANFSTNGGATSVTIRGVGSDSLSQPKDDPSIAAHLDGVYLTRPASLGTLLYDIDRIEVLRGPQGTLYGRNATGGALNIITQLPTDLFQARGDASIGNYQSRQVRAMVNVPLADTLKVRGSVVYNKHNGYSKQLNPQFKNGDDADDIGGRATLLWNALPNVSVTLRANLYYSDGVGPTRNLLDSRSLAGVVDANGVPYGSSTGAIIVNRCSFAAYPEACNDPRAFASSIPDHQKIRSNTYSGTLKWDVSGALSVKSITGYTDFEQNKTSSTRPFQPLAVNSQFNFITTSKAFTQEVDVSYDQGGPLTFVGGAFYLHDKGKNLFDQIPTNPVFFVTIKSDQLSTTVSKALFGEVNYKITPAITLTGGIRYTRDKKEGSSQTRVVIPFGPTLNVPLAATRSFSSVDFKVGADWKITQYIFAYANYSTAFKTGGINTGIPINLFYKPEKLRAWQGGVHSDWLGRRLRVNLDGFIYKYKNPQITQVLGTSLETQNASSAKVYGAELTVDARPVRGLDLYGQISYAKSRYGTGIISDIIDLDRFGQNVFGHVDISGKPLRFTPEWSASFGGSYEMPVSNSMSLRLRGDYYWQDDSLARPHGLEIDRINSYSMINASARLNFANKRYFVEAYGKNLTDKTVVSARFVNPLHLAEYRAPRTYGLTLGFNFE